MKTVLVAEDDGSVRDLCFQILKNQGYKVLQAQNGIEALTLTQRYNEQIDLLLTDVVMPGMNGAELAKQLVSLRPEIKILFMSGYQDDVISQYGILNDGVSFIGKPYSPSKLVEKVQEILDCP